jgi:Ti-type conjugative transfer relaxase TraA
MPVCHLGIRNSPGLRMAIYHFSAKVIQRSQGRSAIAAAAYRAAEALHDESLGRTFNYLDKPGVVHSEILLPEGAPTRWLDRSMLWNEAQQVERRKDAVLAREIELALPRELSQAEAIALAQDFVREQFVERGMVADLNVHWGQSADGEAQPHAHIMLTMRRVVPGAAGHPEEGGFGLKERAWNDKALLRNWRTRWAELVNKRLAEVGIDGQVDHRSNAARGIDLEPQNKIGPAGARRAVRGEDAERADEHRAIARRNGERLLAEPELALQALTRQQSTFTRVDLARLVHRHSDGAAQFAAVLAKVEASPELVRIGEDGRGRARYSTREMVGIERRLIATATALNQSTKHRVNDKRREGVINGKHKQLSAEQVVAYLHVTRSRDLSVVVGIAGGGKSTMLGTARQVWEGEGYRVRGAALSGIAADGLEGSAGIQSRTIASWEYAWEQGKEALTAKDVLVVDEAGMIGSRQLSRLITRAHQAGAKLVLVGDAEQLQAIEAGAAFRAIAERVGVIAITEPRRQLVDWQRLATRELATARTDAALDRYQMAGLVQRHATREEARAGVIGAWQLGRERYPEQSQLILAHERVDVRALNAAARAVRRAAGELGPDQVLETEAGPQAFAEGDRIYFLRNERGLGVKNGTLGTLTRIEGSRLTVRLDPHGRAPGPDGAASGKEVTFDLADYADIGHGYAATIHKNQGATVDQAHVLATPGMDRHLTYVAMSRHRHAARLHWSDEDFGSPARLRDLLGRERAKDTTLDYAEPELDPIAAYAERRGLDPLAPASEIVVGDAVRPQATALGRLRRAQLASVLQSALSALWAAVEQQVAIADKIAAAIRVGRPDAAPAKPDGYDGAAMHILDDMTPPRQRPRDHVVRTELEEPKTPQPPAKDPQIPALEETGHLVVQAWIELERTEAKTLAAQDWREWSKAFDGLKALGQAIKRERALDELLRLRGEEFGVGQTTHLGLVLQGTEAEVVWALKQDPSADARSTHSPSHSPSFGP